MNSKSTDYRQGALTAIYDLLDVIHANNNQVTIQDIEQFQEGQLMAQEEITAIQDGQDFGWLDDLIELYDAFFTDGGKKAFVAAIQAHFTAQAKQHQAELLRARIEENENTKLVTYRAEMVRYTDKRIAVLQAELYKLENTNGNT